MVPTSLQCQCRGDPRTKPTWELASYSLPESQNLETCAFADHLAEQGKRPNASLDSLPLMFWWLCILWAWLFQIPLIHLLPEHPWHACTTWYEHDSKNSGSHQWAAHSTTASCSPVTAMLWRTVWQTCKNSIWNLEPCGFHLRIINEWFRRDMHTSVVCPQPCSQWLAFRMISSHSIFSYGRIQLHKMLLDDRRRVPEIVICTWLWEGSNSVE